MYRKNVTRNAPSVMNMSKRGTKKKKPTKTIDYSLTISDLDNYIVDYN